MGEKWKSLRNTVVLIVGLLVFWQLMYFVVGDVAMRSPWQTMRSTVELARTDWFWLHVDNTMRAFAAALAIAIVLGLLIGFALGLHRLSAEAMEPMLVALYSIPKITLYPIILLVFGLTLSAKVAFGALHGIFPMIIFTMSGVKNVKPVLLKTARAMRLSPLASMRAILVPAALPEIFTGFRIGFSLTLLGTLIGELFASDRGLGFMLIRSIEHSDAATILALTLLLFTASALVGWALLRLDRRIRRYKEANPAAM